MKKKQNYKIREDERRKKLKIQPRGHRGERKNERREGMIEGREHRLRKLKELEGEKESSERAPVNQSF